MKQVEGFIEVKGFKLFYRSFGEPEKGNILCLHGGPGMTHDYMLPMADLADRGYRVVFYDQLGCGRSELPADKSLVPERYVEEVETFRRLMKLGRTHVIGSSWGGMLAIAYALKYQRNMRSMVTVGGLHNVLLTILEMQRMKKHLPQQTRQILEEHESRGRLREPRISRRREGVLQ